MMRNEDTVQHLAQGADALVFLVDHSGYRSLEPVLLAPAMRRPIAVDARGALDRARWEGAGFALRSLGRGSPGREGR
jgi:UDPglucose 6-dehydrogenase